MAIATVVGRTGRRGTRVGVLGGARSVRPPAQQLVPILIMGDVIAGSLYSVELCTVLGKLPLEATETSTSFLLLCRVELLIGQGAVLVKGPREGR